jgi:hypothetical protein
MTKWDRTKSAPVRALILYFRHARFPNLNPQVILWAQI